MVTASYSFVMGLLSDFNRARRAFLVAALIFAAGNAGAAEIKEEQIERRYAVSSNASLTIQHIDGSIKIRGSDDPEIRIQATKKAYTAERLKNMVVDVRATSDLVSIETIVPPPNGILHLGDRSGTVDYVITIPRTMRISRLDLNCGEVLLEGLRGGKVTASVGNGWLVANNCFGDLDLKATNGRLQIAYDWWENTPFHVVATSPEGDIRVNIPDYASAGITAHTVDGRIVNGLPVTQEASDTSLRSLNLVVGANPVVTFELSSNSGDIRINKPY